MSMEIVYKSDSISVDGVEISLGEVAANCAKAKIAEYDLVLLKYTDTGFRGFDGVEECRVLTRAGANELIYALSGLTVHFGEIAGKNSEVSITMDASEFEVVSDDTEVQSFMLSNPTYSNYNYSVVDKALEEAQGEANYMGDGPALENLRDWIKRIDSIIALEV